MTAAGSPHSETLGSKPARRLPEAYRCPPRLSSVPSAKASTIRPCRQPHTRGNPQDQTNTGRQIINTLRSQNDQTNNQTPNKGDPVEIHQYKQTTTSHPTGAATRSARVHSPVLKPPRHTTHPHPEHPGRNPWRAPERQPPHKEAVAAREPNSMPIPAPARRRNDPSTPARPAPTGTTPATPCQANNKILRRKEVIQPHLPVRLPCYDLVPITSLTLDGSPQQNWSGHRLRVLPTFMT